MKKIYITPEIEMINLLCFSPVATPLLGKSDDEPITDGELDEAADEYRGSWEGIWDNM